jgi:hypothetical protein
VAHTKAQANYEDLYLQRANFEKDLSELRSEFGNKKIIPAEIEWECLTALSFYPVIEQNDFYLAVLNDPNKKWQSEELLEFIYTKPPLFAPSDTAIYSNTNTILIKMVIDAATGKSHSDF